MVIVVVGKDQIRDTKDVESTSKPINLDEDNKIWIIWLAIIIVIAIFFVVIIFSRNNVTYYYGDDYYSSSTTTTITKTQDGRVVTTITKNRPQMSIGWIIFWFVFILLIFSPTYYYYK